ncbi:MAG TPA: hypothetical protein VEF89_00915 [Solirubrobacteraceae bacterium]|nr:hypothetical protein [Solirubrobacteraceae bacterium]
MREVTGNRIGNALRGLAEDLAFERGRVAQLQRENRDLRTRLTALLLRREEQAPPSEFSEASARDTAS